MHAVNTAHAKSNDVNIEAIGHQWWWEFRYQDSGFTTANELHLPLNQEVSIHVTGYDVIHSFWIPQLARQIDATPNQIHTIYTTAKKPGIYGAGCYEYCGGPHAWMDFRVVVQPKAQYDAWIRHMKTAAPQTTSPLALQGEQLFFNFSCAACHTISGTPAHGLAGPNLTHVASRWAIAGGVLPMSAHNLGLWVNDPNAYKPGVLMPAYSLSPHDQQTIGAYLSTLK
jgi:cytochrome c oxidase subunit 2